MCHLKDFNVIRLFFNVCLNACVEGIVKSSFISRINNKITSWQSVAKHQLQLGHLDNSPNRWLWTLQDCYQKASNCWGVKAIKIHLRNPTCPALISKFLDSRKMNVHTRALVQSATLHYSGFVISWTAFKAELNHFKARQVWEGRQREREKRHLPEIRDDEPPLFHSSASPRYVIH